MKKTKLYVFEHPLVVLRIFVIGFVLVWVVIRQENKTEECIKQTHEVYSNDWNENCAKLNKEPECSLPGDIAKPLIDLKIEKEKQCQSRLKSYLYILDSFR